ncbi:unnamed protein product, partial [Ectocarpus sp. 13 AM-2016]
TSLGKPEKGRHRGGGVVRLLMYIRQHPVSLLFLHSCSPWPTGVKDRVVFNS